MGAMLARTSGGGGESGPVTASGRRRSRAARHPRPRPERSPRGLATLGYPAGAAGPGRGRGPAPALTRALRPCAAPALDSADAGDLTAALCEFDAVLADFASPFHARHFRYEEHLERMKRRSSASVSDSSGFSDSESECGAASGAAAPRALRAPGPRGSARGAGFRALIGKTDAERAPKPSAVSRAPGVSGAARPAGPRPRRAVPGRQAGPHAARRQVSGPGRASPGRPLRAPCRSQRHLQRVWRQRHRRGVQGPREGAGWMYW